MTLKNSSNEKWGISSISKRTVKSQSSNSIAPDRDCKVSGTKIELQKASRIKALDISEESFNAYVEHLFVFHCKNQNDSKTFVSITCNLIL